MNYVDLETSYEDGRPIEIYDITYSGNTWHFTTDLDVLMFDGKRYTPIPIKRGETTNNGDAEKANMEIRISKSCPMAEIFKITPPSEPVTITIRQYHKGAAITNPELQTAVIWKGRIINIVWEEDEMILTTESIFSSMLRIGVTRKYSRQCSHALYGGACRVNKANFVVESVVESHIGTTLRVSHGKPANWFTGGYLVYDNADTGAIERRTITESTATTVTVIGYPLGIRNGITKVKMYAGCNHTIETCRGKYNNVINYGGQPYIPIKNPFGGSTIY